MNRNSIITLPHRSLRKTSQKVGIVTDDIKKVIQDMQAATLDWEQSRAHEVGVALAAVQINVLLKIIVIRNNFDNENDKSFSVFINPEITKYEGSIEEDYEGCLSVLNIYGKVPRYTKVRVKALNQNGEEIRITAEGFLARVFQHEIDHVNGKVFIDHIKDKPEAFFQLTENGNLEQLNYENVVSDKTLWSE